MAYITLLSDFGLQDASVAIAKGILSQYAPQATIVDITHEIIPFHKKQAAYLLGAAYKSFPTGTIHIPIIDVFYDTKPKLVLCEYDNHYFFCADNGLLPLFIEATGAQCWLCQEIGSIHSFHDILHNIGTITRQLQHTIPAGLGLPTHKLFIPEETKNGPHGAFTSEVIHIDTFGNVILGFTRQQQGEIANGNAQFTLRFIQYEEIRDISSNYTDVKEGIKLCRFNNNGHLEIAINKGDAASLFGLRVGSKLNNVQIIFK